jgi:hypothetical protein
MASLLAKQVLQSEDLCNLFHPPNGVSKHHLWPKVYINLCLMLATNAFCKKRVACWVECNSQFC